MVHSSPDVVPQTDDGNAEKRASFDQVQDAINAGEITIRTGLHGC